MIIIAVLAVTILYDLFWSGKDAGQTATQLAPVGSEILMDNIDYTNVYYDEDSNTVNVTLHNTGNDAIAFTKVRIAKVDMDPDSYTEDFELLLKPGDTKKLVITPPNPFHKIDFLTEDSDFITIWHEGPITRMGNIVSGESEQQCGGIRLLDYYNVTFDEDAHKVYVTLRNRRNETIEIDKIRIAEVDRDPNSYLKSFKISLKPGEVKRVEVTPPDPFDKLDFMEATGCDFIVFWNGGPFESVGGVITDVVQGTASKPEGAREACKQVPNIDYYNVTHDIDENKLTAVLKNTGGETVEFDRIRIAEVDRDPNSYTRDFELTIKPGQIKKIVITPPEIFDKIDLLEKPGCNYVILWNGEPLQSINGILTSS